MTHWLFAPPSDFGYEPVSRYLGQEEAARRRALIGLMLALSLTAGFAVWLFGESHPWTTRILMVGMGISLLGAAWLHRHRPPSRVGADLLALLLFAPTAVAPFEMGGVGNPSFPWMLVVPLIPACLGGPRSGMVWAMLVAATGLGTCLWQLSGGPVGAPIPPGQLPLFIIFHTVGVLATICGLVVVQAVLRQLWRRKIGELVGSLQLQLEARELAEQEARESLQVRDEFLATISHELRTPMNGMLGLSELLLDTELDGDQRELVEADLETARGLMGILEQVLDFQALEDQRLSVEVEDFLPARVVQDVVELHQLAALEKGVRLRLIDELPPGFEVRADPRRFRQIVAPLLENAVSFTPGGEVSCSLAPGHDGDLALVVEDDGPGLDPALAEKVFDKCRQLDGASTREHGGLGLGLTLARGLARRMGGDLELLPRGDRGARFLLRLPAARPQATVMELSR